MHGHVNVKEKMMNRRVIFLRGTSTQCIVFLKTNMKQVTFAEGG